MEEGAVGERVVERVDACAGAASPLHVRPKVGGPSGAVRKRVRQVQTRPPVLVPLVRHRRRVPVSVSMVTRVRVSIVRVSIVRVSIVRVSIVRVSIVRVS